MRSDCGSPAWEKPGRSDPSVSAVVRGFCLLAMRTFYLRSLFHGIIQKNPRASTQIGRSFQLGAKILCAQVERGEQEESCVRRAQINRPKEDWPQARKRCEEDCPQERAEESLARQLGEEISRRRSQAS